LESDWTGTQKSWSPWTGTQKSWSPIGELTGSEVQKKFRKSSEKVQKNVETSDKLLMGTQQECPFRGDHWPQYWTKPKHFYVSKVSPEQRNDLFRYFYEHEKHSAGGASASRWHAFKAYNGILLRKVAGYFGLDKSNLMRDWY
jgi:hypothetical protein